MLSIVFGYKLFGVNLLQPFKAFEIGLKSYAFNSRIVLSKLSFLRLILFLKISS
jgi:hypothetical protein